MRLSRNQKLLIRILMKNKKIYEEQKRLVDKYHDLAIKQENQEFWIKAARFVAFPFILVRITYFCYMNVPIVELL